MAHEDFFRIDDIQETNFFDEGPRVSHAKPSFFSTIIPTVKTFNSAALVDSTFLDTSLVNITKILVAVRSEHVDGGILSFEASQDGVTYTPIDSTTEDANLELTSARIDDTFIFSVGYPLTFFRARLNTPVNADAHGSVMLTMTSGSFNITGIDTSAIDGYRQGVELTQQKHFDAGIVKIHAGEPGHVLRKNVFGQDRILFPEASFREVDYFNPVTFLETQGGDALFNNLTYTYPIITGDNDQLESYVFDGVIEPFPIREVAAFFSIEAPFQARSIKGSVMGGNSDQTGASDLVLTVYDFNNKTGSAGEPVPHAFADEKAEPMPTYKSIIRSNAFDDGTTQGWVRRTKEGIVSVTTDDSYEGAYSLKTTHRRHISAGPSLNITDMLMPGATYTFSLFAKLTPGSGNAPLKMSIRRTLASTGEVVVDSIMNYTKVYDQDYWTSQTPAVTGPQSWTKLLGRYSFTAWDDVQQLILYVESRSTTVSFYIDSFTIEELTHAPATTGHFQFRKSIRDPFDDSRSEGFSSPVSLYPRNDPASPYYDPDMVTALGMMSGSTDNYISSLQKSSNSGFSYENNPVGTDSVAFGGMGY